MKNNIEVLFPEIGATTNEPCPMLIEQIERLLEEAKRGELKGLAAALYFANQSTGSVVSCKVPHSRYAILGALAVLTHRFCASASESVVPE